MYLIKYKGRLSIIRHKAIGIDKNIYDSFQIGNSHTNPIWHIKGRQDNLVSNKGNCTYLSTNGKHPRTCTKLLQLDGSVVCLYIRIKPLFLMLI